jgi:ABC-2 type transport system permease protein
MSGSTTTFFMLTLYANVILLPLLTMKLFSEEKRQRTEQLLLTAPVSITGMVMGKFLAAFTIFFGAHTLTSLYTLFLYRYADVKTAVVLGNYLAVLLAGASFIAVGIFVSSITENQLAAAIGTVSVLAVLLCISLVNSVIPVYWIRFVLSSISVFARFQNFTQGVFDIAALFYYLSVTAAFLFLTVRIFEKRRWG